MLLVLCAVLFGLTPLFARGLQAEGMSDAAIAFWRYGVSAVCLLPFVPRRREKRGQALLLGMVGLLMGLGWIAYLSAIRSAPVAAAGVVYMSYPLFTVVFAWILIGHRPGARAVGAGLLILAAAGMLLQPGVLSGPAMKALLWSLPAPMSFSLAILVLTAMTPRLGVFEKMVCALGGAALALGPVALFTPAGGAVPVSAEGWGLLLSLAAGTAFVPQMIYTMAGPFVGPARASATGAFELPTMIVIGWLALGEALGPREALAGAMVVMAICLAPAVRVDPGARG